MGPKKEFTKVIVIDANTVIEGFSVRFEESDSSTLDSSEIFYHQADEDLFRGTGFSPGRINHVNLTSSIKWVTKNTRWQNFYLELRLLSQKKKAFDRGSKGK